MGIYIKGDFKNPYPNCDECIFGELIRCEAISRREVFDYEVDCPLSEIEVSEEQLSKLQASEKSVENTTVSEDFTSISRANSKLEVSEDAISRATALEIYSDLYWMDERLLNFKDELDKVYEKLRNAPSVLPKPKEGKRSRCIWCDSPYRIEYNWIDREGNTASFADEDRHLVATGIANFCPNCGKKMKGKEKIKE